MKTKRAAPAGGDPPGGRGQPAEFPAKPANFDKRALSILVAHYLCKGLKVSEAVRQIRAKHGIALKKTDPYRLFQYAARNKWVAVRPPQDFELSDGLRQQYRLRAVKVVHAATFEEVACRGADMLMEVLKELAQRRREVHIGFAGGHAMRRLAVHLARRLREPAAAKDLPTTLVFHAMVAGFDVHDPSTDPNTFFAYFVDDPELVVKTKFVLLRAPCVVDSSEFGLMKRWAGVREAYEAADQIDIICTSGSSWSDPDSALHAYMQNSPESLEVLEAAGCVGDMLWRPLSADGPIESETKIRAMTLMDLSDLPRFISRDSFKEVLLVLGPCNTCLRPKNDILGTILRLKTPIITRLVVDVASARLL